MTKKKKLKLVVAGLAGRMGQEILKVSEDFDLIAGIDRSHVEGILIEPELKRLKPTKFDVVVDFSSPELFEKLLEQCVELKKPLVSGTTGLNEKHFKLLQSASKKTPLLWAPNMSLGIAMFCELIETTARLKGFDFQIEEFHHRHKKDKPSGTALLLQDVLKKSTETNVPEPVSIRGGGIFGIHRLYAMSPDETLTIEHTALNRSVFAKGALAAAQWLVGQKPGLYKLKDTLKGAARD
jgi:4-hydroxy-tetrahydrodipicolinate reductase